MTDLDALFDSIRERLDALPPGSGEREALIAHLRTLTRRGREPLDYPDPGAVAFPVTLPVAFAVCHPECGAREFIVEGSTQECQHCGSLLFRTETREYMLRESAT